MPNVAGNNLFAGNPLGKNFLGKIRIFFYCRHLETSIEQRRSKITATSTDLMTDTRRNRQRQGTIDYLVDDIVVGKKILTEMFDDY